MKFFCALSYAAFVLAAVLVCGSVVAQTAPQPTVAEQYLLAAVNQERAARGLGPVHLDPALASAAAQHARVMASHHEVAHQFSGEPELTARAASAGVHYSAISENVGEAPTAAGVHDVWMHSDEHRGNLLDPKIDSAGIGVVALDGELYAVEDFAKSVQGLSLDQQESAIGALVTRTQGITLISDPDSIAAARKTCAMSTGYAGSRKPWFVVRFVSAEVTALPDELKSKLATGKFHQAAIGACPGPSGPYASYSVAVLLYP